MNTTSKGETPSLDLRSFSLSISLRIFVPDPDMNPATLIGRPAPSGSKMGVVAIAATSEVNWKRDEHFQTTSRQRVQGLYSRRSLFPFDNPRAFLDIRLQDSGRSIVSTFDSFGIYIAKFQDDQHKASRGEQVLWQRAKFSRR
jgi:hypothetical protein